ncbi:camp-dependent protein kinase regulatory subunit [Coniophora puteana RWD-64-598 SS2]|uniref:cAMP-dependent protein kinase regulatory subunit n=1 Tax=Coniophora puteana (strain RWD-64-598) TaxID=741705 RepID=A0A5M3MUJ6_CONPW|nr:camp-dependent protein kinase regulatory subunit [Coniophora puteana RWD-64-598 SS2]EIW82434.1 camp-dependent protein kinase regulatory subunit [Coniophora puteana RWD-64-598 SS2]
MSTSTFDALIADLTREVHRAQPKDALQFCANWFQARLEEQRTRTRDIVVSRVLSFARDLPTDLFIDTPLTHSSSPAPPDLYAPSARRGSSFPNTFSQSPFGTLNVPGNALLATDTSPSPVGGMPPPAIRELPPTSPLTADPNPFRYEPTTATPTLSSNLTLKPGDYLHPPSSAIFQRRTSVSAESIAVDSGHDEPLPVYPKSDEQLRRIKNSIAKQFLFRDLDEEQETGVLNALQERHVKSGEVVIRQGDVGEYFYVVESGLFNCYVRQDPLPPHFMTGNSSPRNAPSETFVQPGYHPEFGRKVAECKSGDQFGELALMYGHPRAATVQAMEASTLWSLDRITFRTIILKAAHRRRTMYEQFLSSVPLLASLEPGERSKIADALISKVYPDGEAVLRQGEMGDTFFFVEEGEAIVTKSQVGEEGEVREITVGRLKKGDYFGELSLLRLEPRAATVSAVRRQNASESRLKVAALDAPAFTRLLGPLREIMERNAGESYGR